MSCEIGYGKPPVHSRFRKGQSGNPGGVPGPRRAFERRMQARIEEALRSSPAGFAAGSPDDASGEAANIITEAAAKADTAAIRLAFSFLAERGRKRPRRMRPPSRFKHVLERAYAETQGISDAPRKRRAQSQGISPDFPPRNKSAEISGRHFPAAKSQGITGDVSRTRYVPTGGRTMSRNDGSRRENATACNFREFHAIRAPPEAARPATT